MPAQDDRRHGLLLAAMARYADEGAIAQSAQSYYHLPVPNGLPWTGEIVDLIDELGAERLPDHLTANKRAERAEQRQREAERQALRESITDRIARAAELDAEERSQLRDDIGHAYDRWSPEVRDLTDQLDELDRQATDHHREPRPRRIHSSKETPPSRIDAPALL